MNPNYCESLVPSISKIEITNSKIVNFYNSQPNINIEEVNIHFINLMNNSSTHSGYNTILSTMPKENVDKNPKPDFISTISLLFPAAEMVFNNDIVNMKRIQKSRILMKSIYIDYNISNESIGEFVELINKENCNGIIFSQNSGISNKQNFQIDFHNKNIIVYVHNVKYSHYIITSAIDIIDTLYSKLQTFSSNYGEDYSIPKEIMDNINDEYNLFISQKKELIEIIKEYNKKMLSQLEECRFSSLSIFLSEKYSIPVTKSGFNCELCKKYSGHNLKALAAHKRGCMRKKREIKNL